MLSKFVDINRCITRKFLEGFSKVFGALEDPEKDFLKMLGEHSYKSVIEIGGANRPLFKKEALEKYVGIDIDKTFDWKPIYSEFYAQPCEIPLPTDVYGDLIVSKYLLEHTIDNRRVFKNITQMLSKNGVSIHIFPLGFHPYSLINRLVGNRIAKILIPILRPGSEMITGYPAHYHMCNSLDLKKLLNKLKIRYQIKYYFGAEDYFGFCAPLGCLVHIFNRIAFKFKLNIFASNAVLVTYK